MSKDSGKTDTRGHRRTCDKNCCKNILNNAKNFDIGGIILLSPWKEISEWIYILLLNQRLSESIFKI